MKEIIGYSFNRRNVHCCVVCVYVCLIQTGVEVMGLGERIHNQTQGEVFERLLWVVGGPGKLQCLQEVHLGTQREIVEKNAYNLCLR